MFYKWEEYSISRKNKDLIGSFSDTKGKLVLWMGREPY